MMVDNEKITELNVKTAKEQYELPVIEMIIFDSNDVITTSSIFPGDDDPMLPPDRF